MDSLILSWDGSKSFFELGTLTALREMNMKIDAVTGCTFGTINAAFVAQGNIDNALKFWNIAVKRGIFNVNRYIAELYEKEWSSLDERVFRKVFARFITRKTPQLLAFKKLLEEFISEREIRQSDIRLSITTVNLNTLEYEPVFIEDIPKGKLITYIMAAVCFPQIAKFEESSSIAKMSEYSLSILAKYNYNNIICLDEGVSLLKIPDFMNVKMIKSNDFLGLSNDYNLNTMRKGIKMGYLETLKAYGNLSGLFYFFKEDPNDTEYLKLKKKIGNKYGNKLDVLISVLSGIRNVNKATMDATLKRMLKGTAFRNNNPYISSLEILGRIFAIPRAEAYSFSEFKELLMKEIKANLPANQKALQNKKYLGKLLRHSPRGLNLNKNIFLQYLLILISSEPANYAKLAVIIRGLPPHFKAALIMLIYILY